MTREIRRLRRPHGRPPRSRAKHCSTILAPVGVPQDAEYAYYDLGLCGPFEPAVGDGKARPSLAATTTLCGVFLVPTLRNIALTAPYFHNGVFGNLHQVVEWYVTRDINNNTANNPNPVPAGPGGNPYEVLGTFYTAFDGSPDLYEYNDLPAAYDANVNVGEVPYTPPVFSGGQAPTLTAEEIDDVVAFLCTLTDGVNPDDPSAHNVPAQCQPAATTSATAHTHKDFHDEPQGARIQPSPHDSTAPGDLPGRVALRRWHSWRPNFPRRADPRAAPNRCTDAAAAGGAGAVEGTGGSKSDAAGKAAGV